MVEYMRIKPSSPIDELGAMKLLFIDEDIEELPQVRFQDYQDFTDIVARAVELIRSANRDEENKER